MIGGPNWNSHVKDICANMSESWCNSAKGNEHMEAQPLKSREWYTQITISDRYQEYDPLYDEREQVMPMISPGLDSIDTVPIHLVVGADDTHCSLEHAQRIQKEIGSAVRSLDTMEGFSHGTFGSATEKEYVDLILKLLAEDESQADHANEAAEYILQ